MNACVMLYMLYIYMCVHKLVIVVIFCCCCLSQGARAWYERESKLVIDYSKLNVDLKDVS